MNTDMSTIINKDTSAGTNTDRETKINQIDLLPKVHK